MVVVVSVGDAFLQKGQRKYSELIIRWILSIFDELKLLNIKALHPFKVLIEKRKLKHVFFFVYFSNKHYFVVVNYVKSIHKIHLNWVTVWYGGRAGFLYTLLRFLKLSPIVP